LLSVLHHKQNVQACLSFDEPYPKPSANLDNANWAKNLGPADRRAALTLPEHEQKELPHCAEYGEAAQASHEIDPLTQNYQAW
jgi:hypothetical protein